MMRNTLIAILLLSVALAQSRLRSLHPYEVPEILQIPVGAGWPDYLEWVAAQCRQPEGGG